MRLRVLDDVRPGYARLQFDGQLTRPTLALSIRSLQEGAFLGPDGSWRKSPHFFSASRVEGDERSTMYRIGPEVVNYLRDLDTIEFVTDDGALRVETTWENAVPQMPKSPGRQQGHSIYREQSPSSQSPATVAEPVELSCADATGQAGSLQESFPPPETAPPERHPAPLAAEDAAQRVAPAEREPVPTVKQPSATRGGGNRQFALLLLGLVGLGVVGFMIYQFLPCDWLPEGYCRLDKAEVEAAKKAGVCAFYKAQGGRDCEIAKDCIDPYLASFPKGPSRAELEARARASNDVCSQMVEKAKSTFACIDELKTRGRSRCDVRMACTQTFQSLYSVGPLRQKIDAALQQAEVDCECERNATACARGADDKSDLVKEEARTWLEANACASDAARKCASPGCFANYLSKFGVSGAHGNEARNDADAITRDCAANSDEKEDQAWRSARQCASSASACSVASCYAESYVARYPTGAHRAEANVEMSRAQDTCQKLPRQTPVSDGKYWGRSLAACGAKSDFSVSVDVNGNQIGWEHDFLGVKYRWDGTIDSLGNISAKVANATATATGVFREEGEKFIQMRYPQCTSGPVSLEIRGKYQ
jgi:hypothetical protein